MTVSFTTPGLRAPSPALPAFQLLGAAQGPHRAVEVQVASKLRGDQSVDGVAGSAPEMPDPTAIDLVSVTTRAGLAMVNVVPFGGSWIGVHQVSKAPAVDHIRASHCRSFDHRCRVRAPLTAIASAFRCPTSTTRRLPRVTPV